MREKGLVHYGQIKVFNIYPMGVSDSSEAVDF